MLTACGTPANPSLRTVATVDGIAVTRGDVQRYTNYTLHFYSRGRQVLSRGGQRCISTAACGSLERDVLARLIEEKVVLAYAQHRDIKLTGQDRDQIALEVEQLKGVTGMRSLKSLHISVPFLRSLLVTQKLVERVEAAVTAQAMHAPAYHLQTLVLPENHRTSSSVQYRRALGVVNGNPPPAGTEMQDSWVLASAPPAALKPLLADASPAQVIGPIANGNRLSVVRVLAKQPMPPSSAAARQLQLHVFRAWLARTVRAARPRCLDSHGHSVRCPVVYP